VNIGDKLDLNALAMLSVNGNGNRLAVEQVRFTIPRGAGAAWVHSAGTRIKSGCLPTTAVQHWSAVHPLIAITKQAINTARLAAQWRIQA
jgi:hypothetical protein